MSSSVDLDPPVAREEPSHGLANASFLLALAGCSVLAVPVSAVMAVVVLRRGRRTGDDHGSIAAVGALAVDVLWVVVLSFVGAMVATGQFGVDQGHRDHDGRVTSPQQLSALALRTGDCFDSADYVPGGPDDGTVSPPTLGRVTIEPCSESHQLEVYDDVAIGRGGAYPGASALVDLARATCRGALQSFVGVPPDRSRLATVYLYPTSLLWRDSDLRRIICVLQDRTGPVTGSLRGSRR